MNNITNFLLKLPKNLQSLHEHEKEIHNKSVLLINTHDELKEHLYMVYSSLNVVFNTRFYKAQTDDELTIQALGIRLFNSIVSSLKLLLAGYYQNSVMIQRDILETGFLLDYFSIYPSKISDWRNSNSRDMRNYRPKVIRDGLNTRDGVEESKRDEIYKKMCEMATHPTFMGFDLIAPRGLGETGPFYHIRFLIACFKELAKWVPLFTLIYLNHFKNKKLPSKLLVARNEFIDKIKIWAQEYINLDLSTIDTRKLKAWVDVQ